jgi:hypothetical protein
MIALTTVTATKPATNFWKSALWAGLFSAIVAVLIAFAFPRDMIWLVIPAILLLGAAPVLGFQLAKGKIFSAWLPLLGGVLGFIPFIVPVVGWFLAPILWAVLVGLMTKGQSFGRLLLWSIIGLVLALVVWSAYAFLFGQDPTLWVGIASVLGISFWGGTVGAAMARYDHADEE